MFRTYIETWPNRVRICLVKRGRICAEETLTRPTGATQVAQVVAQMCKKLQVPTIQTMNLAIEVGKKLDIYGKTRKVSGA